ncbi:hypothetical protein B0H14DRAFT_3019506 [Mycena olivaceomarginata]|nr:hypothetical protein B0H14DRAFT_3019506 [Mycena olivaceomarginata]
MNSNPARVASHCLLNSAAIRHAVAKSKAARSRGLSSVFLHWLPPSSLASSILTAPSCLFINDFTTFPAVASSVPRCSHTSRYSQRGDIGRRRLKPRTTIFSYLMATNSPGTFKAKYRVSPPCALPAGRSHACRVARCSLSRITPRWTCPKRSSAPRRATRSRRSPTTRCIPRT